MSHAIAPTACGWLSAGPVTSGRELGLFGGRPNGECVAQQRPSDDGCRPWPNQQIESAGGWCRLTEPSPLAGRPTPPHRAWASSCNDPGRRPAPRAAAQWRGGWWPRWSWPHTTTDHRHQPSLAKRPARDQRTGQTVRNSARACAATAPANHLHLCTRQPSQVNS